MLFNLIKILLLFIFFYFIYNIIKTVLFINKKVNNAKEDHESIRDKKHNSGKTIELDKDQYKVE